MIDLRITLYKIFYGKYIIKKILMLISISSAQRYHSIKNSAAEIIVKTQFAIIISQNGSTRNVEK